MVKTWHNLRSYLCSLGSLLQKQSYVYFPCVFKSLTTPFLKLLKFADIIGGGGKPIDGHAHLTKS